jgi:hypothetical protein
MFLRHPSNKRSRQSKLISLCRVGELVNENGFEGQSSLRLKPIPEAELAAIVLGIWKGGSMKSRRRGRPWRAELPNYGVLNGLQCCRDGPSHVLRACRRCYPVAKLGATEPLLSEDHANSGAIGLYVEAFGNGVRQPVRESACQTVGIDYGMRQVRYPSQMLVGTRGVCTKVMMKRAPLGASRGERLA